MRRSNVPFFTNPAFFPSPPKSYELSNYVEGLYRDFVTVHLKITSRAHLVDPCILEFVDDCAIEPHKESSDSASSLSLFHSS